MSEGKWTGGIANRTWARSNGVVTDLAGDAERAPRLYEMNRANRFLCEACGRTHPLQEHRDCRAAGAAGPRSFSNGNAGPDEDLWSGWVLRPVHWWHWA